MVNKVKVLIGDDSVEYGIACASTLRGQGMYVMTRPKDGTALLETIKSDAPDVVVMDAILPHMDAIELMKKVQASGGKRPQFIVTSAYDNPFIEKQVMQGGAAYFMLKPFEISALGERITSLTQGGMTGRNAPGTENMEIVVTDVIHQLGVPAHIKGITTCGRRSCPRLRIRNCWKASPSCCIPRWQSGLTPPRPGWSVPSATPSRLPGTGATWTR